MPLFLLLWAFTDEGIVSPTVLSKMKLPPSLFYCYFFPSTSILIDIHFSFLFRNFAQQTHVVLANQISILRICESSQKAPPPPSSYFLIVASKWKICTIMFQFWKWPLCLLSCTYCPGQFLLFSLVVYVEKCREAQLH